MSFDLQPTLKGEKLSLRPVRAEDWEGLFAVASDPLVWEQHPDSDRYTEPVFRKFFRDAMESGGALIARDAVTGEVIGSSRFYGYDSKKREIEIGWTFLARAYWGGAYNREMKQLMLDHAFKYVDTVVFLIGPNNIRSQRAVEKIGATRVANRIGANGRESYAFTISLDAWQQRGAKAK